MIIRTLPHTHTHMHMCTHMLSHTHTHTYTHSHTHSLTLTLTLTRTHTHTHMHSHSHALTHILHATHTHTHTHTTHNTQMWHHNYYNTSVSSLTRDRISPFWKLSSYKTNKQTNKQNKHIQINKHTKTKEVNWILMSHTQIARLITFCLWDGHCSRFHN